jgi:hypothetical protein
MKFYRNHYASETDAGESMGYSFFTSKAAAVGEAKGKTPHNHDHSNIAVPIEVEPTRQGILLGLNKFGGHPDNG